MPTGSPKYETPEQLEAKVKEYFETGRRTRKVLSKEGVEVEIPCPTITDLCLFLGFDSRQSFYDYEKRDGFSYTIKKARSLIEREYEELLQRGLGAGAIFALKNFGWVDKTEVDQNVKFSQMGDVKIDGKTVELRIG